MAATPKYGTLVLSWTELHQWSVPCANVDDPADVMRAAREATECSGIFQRLGVPPGSISFAVRSDS